MSKWDVTELILALVGAIAIVYFVAGFAVGHAL